MQSSSRQTALKRPYGWLCLLLPTISLGCVVTTQGGPGTPPVSAIEERPTSHPTAASNRPTEIGAKHLLVQYKGSQSASARITRSKVEARQRAEEALSRARAGEDFGAIVGEYSDEPGAKERGGSLGRFQHHAMVRQFSDAAFALKVGQLSDVVETPFGFHVILRTE